MKKEVIEYQRKWLAKMRELEELGYRSGTNWGEPDGRCAIVKGNYPYSKIVGYLNRDLTITWL